MQVADTTPDLVLMDIVMPEMDGIAATEHLRRKPGRTHLPVIALSANASMADQERAMTAGADAFPPKPIERDLLLARIGQCLS